MTITDPPSPTANAFCLGCGYALRRLESNRCPECGRPFDPADPRTLSVGFPLRPWQRRLLRPPGWPLLTLALLGTAGFAYLGGWPRLSPEPLAVLQDEFHWPSSALRPFTMPDIVFYAAASLWAAFLALFTLRQLARLLVPRVVRRGNVWASRVRRRNRAVAALTILSACWMVFDWQHRIGQRWIARVFRPALIVPPRWSMPYQQYQPYQPLPASPVQLTPHQESLVLGDAIAHLRSSSDRMAVMKLLVESHGRAVLPGLVRIAESERDPALLVWELRLIGLCRNPDSASLLTARLQDSRPEVRAAAADAIGILRHPSYSIGSVFPWGPILLDKPFSGQSALESTPPIKIDSLFSGPTTSPTGNYDDDLLDEPPIAVDPSLRPILQRMMTNGATAEEREAAARTLVAWPPGNYQLRVAEWGVWMSDHGHLALARSILRDIPPFVHQTGHPASGFSDYFLDIQLRVFKPIVHLTSDVALAADVEVHIRGGRPWFGYPMPDDFGIGTQDDGQEIWHDAGYPPTLTRASNGLAASSIAVLPDFREGYPWLSPHHRLYSALTGKPPRSPIIYNLGLRWQSLIISPEHRPWMTPPAAPDDPRFRWWARLRDVPSSWLASRGEAERFLYYDGPTDLSAPIFVRLEDSGHRLQFKAPRKGAVSGRPEPYPRHPFEPLKSDPAGNLPEREGLYIEVHSGMVRGQHMKVEDDASVSLAPDLLLHGDAVIQQLRTMLTSFGLTVPEAEGLIVAWMPQFFRTEGRRFLLRVSAADYDWQCPIQVRPKPTQLVRLGLVLTEFDARPQTRPADVPSH